MLKQISIFLENSPGRLNNLLKSLSDHEINITSLAIADTGEYGITRLIVTDSAASVRVLKEGGFIVTVTDVLAVLIPNRPGALYDVTKLLTDNGVNVEYAYSALPNEYGKALIIIRVDYPESAEKVLAASGIEMVQDLEGPIERN
jgi:hypothetical protein